MPPRGTGRSRHSGYFGGGPWNNEVSFSMDSLYEPKSYFIAGFVFDALTVIALIGFLIWACLIPNHRGSMRGVIASLVTWLLAALIILVYDIFFLVNVELTEYFRIDLILYDFFDLFSSCLVFFVFYNLIHGLLDRLTDAGKPYAVVSAVHWVVLGVVSMLSIAAWGLYIAFEVLEVTKGYTSSNNVIMADIKVGSVQAIVYWLISLEILAWPLFVVTKAGFYRFTSKTPTVALVIGSVFWFALNLMWTIVSIRYNLETTFVYPEYLQIVESICQLFFIIGIWVGLLLCCSSWSELDKFIDQPGAAGQYPFDAVPDNQHASQDYQPYLQQPYPQSPQPYPQPPYLQQQQ